MNSSDTQKPVDKSLVNLKMKGEILRRVFGEDRKVYQHDFPLKGYKCTKCGTQFWDWVFQDKDGNICVGQTMCAVIGLEEVAQFGDPDNIRGDDGGY